MHENVFIVDKKYYDKNREIWDWIRYNNPMSGTWDIIDIFGYMHYTFDDVNDYTLFVLTWNEYGKR